MKPLSFDETAPYTKARRQLVTAFKRAYAAEVLKRAGGNMSEAARQAGMDRGNFRRLTKTVG